MEEKFREKGMDVNWEKVNSNGHGKRRIRKGI
jgi:hypothetical protein